MCLKSIIKSGQGIFEKFFDAIIKGVGKACEPAYIKGKYRAYAKGIKSIAKAAEKVNAQVSFNDGVLSVDNVEIFDRAKNRIIYQEIYKQANIESVIVRAYDEIKEIKSYDKKPIDEGWAIRFFNSIQDVSNEELQKIWAKLLSGEIKKTGSVSLRTMDHLKNISSEEAKMFSEMLKYTLFDDEGKAFLLESLVIESKIKYGDILVIEDCGLIKSQRASLTFVKNDNISQISNKNECITLNLQEGQPVVFYVYPYSTSGEELAKILCKESYKSPLIAVKKELDLMGVTYEETSSSVE